jgi:hypothetical protein
LGPISRKTAAGRIAAAARTAGRKRTGSRRLRHQWAGPHSDSANGAAVTVETRGARGGPEARSPSRSRSSASRTGSMAALWKA